MAEILLGRALGPQAFDRPVALKRILPHLAKDRAFIDMFVREAHIAASIRHTRVAQVHELANFDGEYVLIMEYVEGESLGGLMRCLWLRGKSLDRVLAAYIIAEACAGLHAAHELSDASSGREVIHRDVSPQNIMITYAGDVKVLDFGIAKVTSSAPTQGGQIKGKCEYMSPEQCRGEPLDRRSDIFSLGILLYELTLGKRLFKRDNALLVFHAVCDEPIPRPTDVDPDYPQILEAICARALTRDRRDRYATMVEMRRDLVAAIRRMSHLDERTGEQEVLAGLMSQLFADRIEEKRNMLLHARTGSTVDWFPVAQSDAQVERPEVPRAPRVGPAIGGRSWLSMFARTGVCRPALVAGAAAVAAALAGAHLGPGSDAARSTPPAVAAAATAGALPAPAREPASIDKPATMSFAIDPAPSGADGVVRGELRGRSACSVPISNPKKSSLARSTSSKKDAPVVFERFE